MPSRTLAVSVCLALLIGLGASALTARALLHTRTTINGCGAGFDANSQGSRVVQWFSEVVVWRPASGLPVRHAWLTLVNPTTSEQWVVFTGLVNGPVNAERSGGVRVPRRSRIAVDLGAWFWPELPRVDFGLEVRWQTYGAATVTLWDEAYSLPVIVPATLGCEEAWGDPYGERP